MAKRLLARVRELREAKDLTQAQFAERADIDYKYYQHLEAGRRIDVKLSTLQKLAKACGIELYELLNFDSPLVAVGDEQTGTYETAPDAPPPKKKRKPSNARLKKPNN